MYAQGTVAKKTSQQIKKGFEKTTAPIKMLNILRKHIRVVSATEKEQEKQFQKREVILSGYLLKD